jgi:hypothetical protein
LRQVLEDAALSHNLGLVGRRCVETNWTWDAACERLEAQLFAIAGVRSGGGA